MSINKVLIEGTLCALPKPIHQFEKSLALLSVASSDSIRTPAGIQLVNTVHQVVISSTHLSKLSGKGTRVYIEGSLVGESVLSSFGLTANVIWGNILHAQSETLPLAQNFV